MTKAYKEPKVVSSQPQTTPKQKKTKLAKRRRFLMDSTGQCTERHHIKNLEIIETARNFLVKWQYTAPLRFCVGFASFAKTQTKPRIQTQSTNEPKILKDFSCLAFKERHTAI